MQVLIHRTKILVLPGCSRTPGYGVIALVAMLIVTLFIIRPVWQVHDDVYYAMLAEGYGILERPVEAMPYMHPIIGQILSVVRLLETGYSYAIFLIGCVLIGTIAVGYRLLKDEQGPFAWVLVSAGIAPFILQLQYTYVSGFLVACAAVLWAGRGDVEPTPREWMFGAVLILMAMFFRVSMAAAAAACLFPILLWNARSRALLNRAWIIGFFSAIAAVILLHALASYGLQDTWLSEFYRLNDPVATLKNYGYIEAIRYYRGFLTTGFTENDIGLLGEWFFGDLSMLEPSRMYALMESVPFEHVLRARYWAGIESIKNLPEQLFFWFLLAATWMSFFSRMRNAILVGVGTFVVIYLASASFVRPFPERVAGGIAAGLFFLASISIQASSPPRARRISRLALCIAMAMLAPVALIICSDRMRLHYEEQAWKKDVQMLESEKLVYAFGGEINLRAGYRPFDVGSRSPRIIFLGSMYLLPELREQELASGCGGFLECLASGRRFSLVASHNNVEQLQQLVQERYAKPLVVEDRTEYASFTLYGISVQNAKTSLVQQP
jgi:hypothetical protein